MNEYAPITADDATLREAVNEASIPALMVAVMHLTGNTDHFKGDFRPVTEPLGEDDDSLTDEQRAPIREMAFQALSDYRDRGCTLPAAPNEDMILEAMHFITGHPIPDEHMPYLREELVLNGEDPRKIDFQVPPDRADFSVLIIGAGMSGILAALRLKEAGVTYMVAEKNAEIAGTWWENTYPGCRVDSPNHVYSYLHAPKGDWPGYFSTRKTLFEYFDKCVDAFGVRDAIQLGTSVDSATYDGATGKWRVALRRVDGTSETKDFNAILTATGQLNIPKMPDIPGLESFEGQSFHSARWDYEVDLKGKRVAVIGTGASATQFVPIIANDVADMVVFQRTPPWLLPTPLYHEDVSDGQQWLFKNMPFYAQWYRFWLVRRDGADGALPYLRADPTWNGPENSVGPENDELRVILTEYTLEQAIGDDDLAAKLIPDYPPGGKRPLRDTGVWIEALRRDNVHLVDNPIVEVTATGLVTEDGTEYPVDVLIYGTGFQADHFFTPIEFYGKDGVSLNQQWDGDPRAHKGITVPNFPNLFFLYGPNTNIVVGTGIVFFTECQVRYIMGCLKLLTENGSIAMECKQDVHDAYNDFIDKGNALRAWGAPNVRSWYKNDRGRVTQNWPGTHHEFWEETRTVNPEDFIFT